VSEFGSNTLFFDRSGHAPYRDELMPTRAGRILRLSLTRAAGAYVPVTARLSKRFHDDLDEDVARELVDCCHALDHLPNDQGELGTRLQAPSLVPVRVRLFVPG
jgi:hypothetical protein